MNFTIGETAGDYRILEELGRGGMGRVFRVEHLITKRQEAMKVLQGGRPDAPEQAERSLKEIQVQASLPGASPETMASSIATPLERQFGRIASVTEMTSSSSLGSNE